ncbi:MAG: DUF4835 family protein [Chitinophagaceae bacterium]|nr:DUF4835 family protein [Chitinophagaceae bacterium]
MKKWIILLLCGFGSLYSAAQEFKAKVIVIAEQVQGTDPQVFKTMEQAITEFINTRKWTSESFTNAEKIECVMTVVVTKLIEGVEGGFTGRISVQATRPVYNTNYTSPMVNFVDKDLSFKYVQFQPIEFNDNRITGSDALVSNLPAVIAYYCYIILGLDYDSFALKGGTEYFNRALNIANNAPENKAISGWKATENQKNRFWLIDQILNSRFAGMREVVYKYHRLGMDVLSSDPESARNTMNGLFTTMQQINNENPSSIWLQFFFNAKSDEVVNFLSQATLIEKQKIVPIVSQLDVSNAGKYANLLK